MVGFFALSSVHSVLITTVVMLVTQYAATDEITIIGIFQNSTRCLSPFTPQKCSRKMLPVLAFFWPVSDITANTPYV